MQDTSSLQFSYKEWLVHVDFGMDYREHRRYSFTMAQSLLNIPPLPQPLSADTHTEPDTDNLGSFFRWLAFLCASRARIFELLRGPRIDSKESILPARGKKYGVRFPKFIRASVNSCTHWLRPRNSPSSPAFGLIYEGAIGQPKYCRRHLFVTPCRQLM